jgi:hypothetical protein
MSHEFLYAYDTGEKKISMKSAETRDWVLGFEEELWKKGMFWSQEIETESREGE